MSWRFFIAFLFLAVFTPHFAQETAHNHSIQHAFIENKGQWEKPILFKTHFSAGNLWIQQRKFVFHLQDYSNMQKNHGNLNATGLEAAIRQTVVHLNFSGANEVTHIEKHHETASYYNYFLGNNPARWKENVKGYGEAILKEFYAGIDLKLIEEQDQLKYEFHVQPKADPSAIGFSYSGQKSVKIDKKGNLIVATELGNIIEQKPYAYQVVNGKILEVPCEFELTNGEVKFKLGTYNPSAILVIDPVLIFATYSGSVTDNFGMTATYGYDGTAYSGGTIYGNSYPTPDNSAFDVNSNFTVANNGNGLGYGITDVFISKYSTDGTTMLWTTFLGGGNDQQGTETVHS
ncbi:MAG: hypothetical protein RL265_301, partial [Bacteroidota bacterium]